MTRCGNTQPHTKGLSLNLKQDRGRLPAAPHLHVHTGRARAPTGRRQAYTQGCIVRCAEPRETRAGIQDATCADASGAKEQIAKKLAAEIAGAKGLERARRGGCGCEERKAACTRHGEPARARPRPHARLEGGAGRGEREGFASSLPRVAGSCRQGLDGIFRGMQIVKGLPLRLSFCTGV